MFGRAVADAMHGSVRGGQGLVAVADRYPDPAIAKVETERPATWPGRFAGCGLFDGQEPIPAT